MIKHYDYPDGIDCVWVASDKFGRVGAFITAGVAPIPKFALDNEVDILGVEGRLLELPAISTAIVVCDVPQPDDFIALASRGIYVYDWTDIARIKKQEINAYELVALPENPIYMKDFNLKICTEIYETGAHELDFSKSNINVRKLFDCVESG